MGTGDVTSSEEKILNMVREQLQRTNPPSTEALYGRAARIDSSIRALSLRQFNARYPLRVRREMAREEKGTEVAETGEVEHAPPPSRDEPDRAALRQLFHDLAAHVATTDAGPALIDLFEEELDGYVDRAVAAFPEE